MSVRRATPQQSGVRPPRRSLDAVLRAGMVRREAEAAEVDAPLPADVRRMIGRRLVTNLRVQIKEEPVSTKSASYDGKRDILVEYRFTVIVDYDPSGAQWEHWLAPLYDAQAVVDGLIDDAYYEMLDALPELAPDFVDILDETTRIAESDWMQGDGRGWQAVEWNNRARQIPFRGVVSIPLGLKSQMNAAATQRRVDQARAICNRFSQAIRGGFVERWNWYLTEDNVNAPLDAEDTGEVDGPYDFKTTLSGNTRTQSMFFRMLVDDEEVADQMRELALADPDDFAVDSSRSRSPSFT